MRYLEASPTLMVKQLYTSEAVAEKAILQRDIYAVVIIPEDFSRNILSGKPAPLILQVNAQYGTHSGIIQTGVQAVTGTLSAGVEIQRLVKQGVAPSQAVIAYSPISIQRISLFNTATNYQQFLASTVIPALLHILAMVIGATTIGRELRDKNIGHWYDFITNKKTDTAHEDTQPRQASFSVLLFGLLGKYFWPMMAYSIWSMLAVWFAAPQDVIAIGSVIATYVGLLYMMLSFLIGAILTLNSFSLRMGLSSTGFVSPLSYAFAGVTFPYIAISDNAKHWSDVLPLTHCLKATHCTITDERPCGCVITDCLWPHNCDNHYDDLDDAIDQTCIGTSRTLGSTLMSLLPKQNPSSMAEHSTLQATSPTFWDGFLRTLKAYFLIKVCCYY